MPEMFCAAGNQVVHLANPYPVFLIFSSGDVTALNENNNPARYARARQNQTLLIVTLVKSM
jgi:hypothetical protein